MVKIIIGILAGLVAGAIIGFFIGIAHRKRVAEAAVGSAEKEANRILNDAIAQAEAKKKEAVLEAKDEIHKQRTETERELRDRRKEVTRLEQRITQKEEALDRKTDNLRIQSCFRCERFRGRGGQAFHAGRPASRPYQSHSG